MLKIANRIPLSIIVILALMTGGCSKHVVNDLPKWCDYLTGLDLEEKYKPFWALSFSVQFDEDAVRGDYVDWLNETLLEQVDNRAQRMAWREDMELHMINISVC